MNLKTILQFLDGKKAIITGVLLTTISFLVLKGILDADTGAYLSTIITLVFGSAEVATPKVLGSRRK